MRATLYALCLFVACVARATPAGAQSLADARDVSLGGISRAHEVFSDDPARQHDRQIVVPVGLLQLVANRGIFRPTSREFDPSLALEYAAAPTFYVIGRRPSTPRAAFFADIRHGTLSSNLNAYRGFAPATSTTGQGLASPTWGGSFRLHEAAGRSHRVYVGAGPYVAVRTEAQLDPRLVSLLAAPVESVVRDSSMTIRNESRVQGAMHIVSGYRGRFWAHRGTGTGDIAVDVEATAHYLHGFRYEDVRLTLRVDTDAAGLVALDGTHTAPLLVGRQFSSSGRGFATDVGIAATLRRVRVSVRADGIGNRITWTGVRSRSYTRATLTNGIGGLVESDIASLPDIRHTLPVDLRLQGSYRNGAWGLVGEIDDGVRGRGASVGLERRFSRLELRSGGRLANREWLPGAGISMKAGRVWVDVGAAATTTNLEHRRRVMVATSLRIMSGGNGSIALPRVR
jgi:hypothetical protein